MVSEQPDLSQLGGSGDCESKNIFIGFKQAMSTMIPTQTHAMIIKPSVYASV
jgi:hypothetical protein